jgi:hypothetical protein
MVRIFALTSLLALFHVWALRQGLDSQSVARAGDTMEDRHEVREAQVAVQTQHAIFGHTALEALKYSLRANNGVCNDVVNKISDFAKAELVRSTTADESIDVDVDKSFLHDVDVVGPQQLSEAFAVLDQSDLRDAMQVGEVWTLDDQDTLIKCETGKSIRLEEETQTDSGAELLQGDMLVLPEDSTSFLQFQTLIAAGSRWAGQRWPESDTVTTTVHYCFHESLHEQAKKAFQKAIEHTAGQVLCLEFEELPYNPHTGSCSGIPSIKIQDTDLDRCWSHVGMQLSFKSRGP